MDAGVRLRKITAFPATGQMPRAGEAVFIGVVKNQDLTPLRGGIFERQLRATAYGGNFL